MKYLFLLSLLLTPPVMATTSITLETGIYTNHLDSGNWNEDNKLKGLEVSQGGYSLNISSFVNSYNNKTTSIGGAYTVKGFKYLDLDIMAGVLKGYTSDELPVCKNKYCVYAAPRAVFHYEYKEYGINLSAIQLGTAFVLNMGASLSF